MQYQCYHIFIHIIVFGFMPYACFKKIITYYLVIYEEMKNVFKNFVSRIVIPGIQREFEF